MIRQKYLVRSDSVLQQLAYGFKKRDRLPEEYPWLGFSLPGPQIGRINGSLRWASVRERIELASAVVAAWQAADNDENQARELTGLFGDHIAPLFGKRLVFTIKKKPRIPWRFIRAWYIDSGSSIPLLRENILFTITCLCQSQADVVIRALRNSPAGIQVVDIAQYSTIDQAA